MITNKLIVFSVLISSVLSQCQYSSADGDYKVSWVLDKANSVVSFKLTAKQKSAAGFWTGIGFGDGMQNADMIIVNTVGEQVSVSDRHSKQYGEPVLDSRQNLQVIKSTVQNGIITAEFSRPIKTGDPDDLTLQDATKNGCQNFIFPESGGSSVSLQKIHKHASTPTVKLICDLDSCAASDSSTGAVFDLSTLVQASVTAATEQIAKTTSQEPQNELTSAVAQNTAPVLPLRPVVPVGGPVDLTDAATLPTVEAPVVPQGPETIVPLSGNATFETDDNQMFTCPMRPDNAVCIKYIDTYFDAVFKEFERNYKNLNKACHLLKIHENGLVLRECCNYLAQPSICRSFMLNSLLEQ